MEKRREALRSFTTRSRRGKSRSNFEAWSGNYRTQKTKFSKVVEKVRREGPQIVALRGERIPVLPSAHDYDLLRAGRLTLVDDLLGGPASDDQLADAVNVRIKTPSRDVGL